MHYEAAIVDRNETIGSKLFQCTIGKAKSQL